MHFREEKRNNKLIITVIIIELLAVAAASYAVFWFSWQRIIPRRAQAIVSVVDNFSTKPITTKLDDFYQKATEQVSESVDETVWTTDSVNYRTGPGTDYERVGTLNIYTGVKRTGKTFNEWSQVEIDGQTYYIISEYLTTEMPLITATGQKGEYQRYAMSILPNYGWDETEIVPLIKLWDRESGWNPNSHNGSSGAHGIPQALPASKMASEGSDYMTNGNTQIRWGLSYIKNRYGSPSNAWGHFCSHNWY